MMGSRGTRVRNGDPVTSFMSRQGRPAFELLEPRLMLSGDPAALTAEQVAFDWSVPPSHVTLSRITPAGTLIARNNTIYSSADVMVINWLGECDTFDFDVDAGQTITVLTEPQDAQLDLVLAMKGPDGSVITIDDRGGRGEPELIQAVGPTESGTYTLAVTSRGGVGSYGLRVYLNVALEEENLLGGANDTAGAAEDIDAAFINLTGQSDRAAALGVLSVESAAAILTEGFESGVLDSTWTTYSSDASGRIVVTDKTSLSAPEGELVLKMHREGNQDLPTLNEAIWTVDLSGRDEAILWFQYGGYFGSVESFDGDFVGHALADGIAISNDGVRWHPIWTPRYYTERISWHGKGVDLANEAGAAGMELGPTLQIKFQDVDNTWTGGDWRGYDDIRILTPERDWFRFTLDAEETVALAVADMDAPGSPANCYVSLYDEGGNLLAISHELAGSVGEVVSGISDFQAKTSGTYYARVGSNYEGERYTLVVIRNGGFYGRSSNDPTPQRMSVSGTMLGNAGTAWWDDGDHHHLPVNASDQLTLITSTPSDGPFDFGNNCDPAIELIDPNGQVVAADNDSGDDGRNALLTYTAATGGIYTVRVYPGAYDKGGPYVLQATGSTGSFPFEVTATDPADDSHPAEAPSRVTIDFSDFILVPSLSASDLTVDGVEATAYFIADGDTVIFDLRAGLADGMHVLAIAGGAILDVQGEPIDAYTGRFVLDRTAPRVIESSISQGDVLAPGVLSYAARFDEELKAASLDASDFSLVGQISGAYAPQGWSYDPTTSTLTLDYADLPDDAYTLTLSSGVDGLEDLAGNDLDGEATAFPIPPNVSGDGGEGGDFAVSFFLDELRIPWRAPVVAADPLTNLIYHSEDTGAISTGDTDAYEINLDAGQTLTVVVQPSEGLRPKVSLADPDGITMAQATAAGPGEQAVIQTSAVTKPGAHVITIVGEDGTTGSYRVRPVLNAAVEEEAYGSASNDDLSSAQDIDASFVDLGGGLLRGAVLGTNPLLVNDSFETGELSPAWSTYNEGNSWVEVTNWTAHDGTYSLSVHGAYHPALSEANLTLDLEGRAPDRLRFWLRPDDYFDRPFPGDFTGHVRACGVAVSVDGQNWHPVFQGDPEEEGWAFYDLDLGAELQAAAMVPGSTLYLRFQRYGQYGDHYDQIVVTTRTEDWYSMTLAQDETATVGLVVPADGNLDLRLYDSTGALVAVAEQTAGDYDAVIENLTVPASGIYYARVAADFDYSLVVTRNGTLDLEQDVGLSLYAQDVTATGAALGSVVSPPDAITTEIEPNNDVTSQSAKDSFPFANDLSGSFVSSGGWTSEVVVTGESARAEWGEHYDCFKVYARADDILQVQLAASDGWVGIYDNMGRQLGYTSSSYAISPSLSGYTGDYYLWVARTVSHGPPEYTLTVTLNRKPYVPNYDDFYAVQAVVGDTIALETVTLFDGPYEIDNSLDPQIELYAPDGSLVAADDNGAADGKNAMLSHSAGQTGKYSVRVLASAGSGQYVLRAGGYSAAARTFEIVSVDPPNGAELTEAPTRMTVDFSAPVLFGSLAPSDLTVDGLAAVGVAAVDSDTAVFDLRSGLADGVHDVAIAAGSVVDLLGTPIQAFATGFTLDLTPPVVVESSITEGDVLAPGDLTVFARFSEELLSSAPPESAFSLWGLTSGPVQAEVWTYDPATATFTAEYSELGEDTYRLSLHSGDGWFEDPFGNDLDGETPAWPIGPDVSGDGVPGGSFDINFAVDPGPFSELPTPLEQVGLPSTMVYASSVAGTIGWDADTDAYALNLDAGQTISVVVHPHAGLQPKISLFDPANATLAAATAPSPGMDALVQTAAVTTAGTYVVLVSPAAPTLGAYDLEVILNAAVEAEEHVGPSNNHVPLAQDIESGFIDLGGGAQRAAVLGTVPSAGGRIVARESFDGGAPGSGWSWYSHGEGIVEFDGYYGQCLRLRFENLAVEGEGYGEAVWAVNLAGVTDATLSFSYSPDHENDPTPFDGPFTGRYNADGIAISEDGTTWYPAWNAFGYSSSNYFDTSVDLGSQAAAAGIPLGSDFKVKFQKYGDGVYNRSSVYDDIVVTASIDDASIAEESFEAGGLSPQWSTWTSGPGGSISVSGAYGASKGSSALVMGATPEDTPMVMEAIWTVDLADLAQAQLNFDFMARNVGTRTYVGHFEGHYEATCVAVSADGQHWYSPWYTQRMNQDWQHYTIDLASALSTGGIDPGGPVLIKFQGYTYNPYGWPEDENLFAWDDISIDLGDDHYSFSLDAGQAVTVSMDILADGASAGLVLLDDSGTVVAGSPVTRYTDEAIQTFVAPQAGTYHARASGFYGADYSLVVLRDAALDREPNDNDNLDSPATAQDITGWATVLGALEPRLENLYVYTYRVLHELDPLTGDELNTVDVSGYGNYGEVGLASTRNSLIFIAEPFKEIDPQTGETIQYLPWARAGGAAFLNNEIFLLSDSPNGMIEVRDYPTANVVRTIYAYDVTYANALAASGTTLYAVDDNTLYEIDPQTGDTTRLGLLTDTGYAWGLAVLEDELFVAEEHGYEVDVYDLHTLAWKRRFQFPNSIFALAGDGPLARHDYYSFLVNVGDEIVVSTATPGGGPLEFANDLDPAIELYDPAGNLIADDDNGAADGRNALLTHTATAGGAYVVRIYNVSGSGPYVLDVSGYTGTLPPPPPFQVSYTDLPDGSLMGQWRDTITVHFSDPVLPNSLDVGDLLVDGQPAEGFVVADVDVIVFDLPAITGHGEHEITIPAGAVLNPWGGAVEEFTSHFTLDLLAPRVVGSSVQEGEIVPMGDRTFTFQFSEPINESILNDQSFSLTSRNYGSFQADSWSCDPTDASLTIEYDDLPDDHYTFTLFSGDMALQDMAGHDLDGEALAWPIPPNVSGDGVEGGDFVVNFRGDVVVTDLPPLEALRPLGSMIYVGEAVSEIFTDTDEDAYLLGLDAGQKISLVVHSDRHLRATVSLIDPSGLVLASASASDTGKQAVLNNLSVDQAGVYRIAVGGAGDTTGAYTVKALLNAAAEGEAHDGPANDDLVSAQDLGASAVALGGGADRLAVVGNLGIIEAADFEAGRLGPDWATWFSNEDAVIVVTDEHGSMFGRGGLWMWSRSPYTNRYSGKEAISTVDLSGLADPVLRFWHLDDNDDQQIRSDGDSVVYRNGVGVVVSDDGVNWHRVWLPPGLPNYANAGRWGVYTLDLAAVAADAGITLGENFQIKFLHYAERGRSTMWDEVAIVTPDVGDLYSFDMAAWQKATIAVRSLKAGDARIELLDAEGNILAAGRAGSTNLDQVISAFAPGVAGSYYVRVTGDTGAEYSLVVTRGVDFDTERNNALGLGAQDITEMGAVLGEVGYTSGRLFAVHGWTNAKWGVEYDLETGAQLGPFNVPFSNASGDSQAGIAATDWSLILGTTADYPLFEIELDTWDVVRTLPNPGVTVTYPTFLDNEIFIPDGSSILVLDYETGEVKRTLETQEAYRLSASRSKLYGSTYRTLYELSPTTGQRTRLGELPEDNTICKVIGDEIVAYSWTDSGSGYLRVFDLATFQLKRELGHVSHLKGLSGDEGVVDDYYSIIAVSGGYVILKTATPSAPGGLINGLDPVIELYDPTGALVARDDNSATDGRNALVRYEATQTGRYTIRVAAANGTAGEYVLDTDVQEYAEMNAYVTDIQPPNGASVDVLPQIIAEFSHPIDAATLDPGDLTLGGIAAAGVSLVDAYTAAFDIPVGLLAGTHTIAIAAGSVGNTYGTMQDAFTSQFTFAPLPMTVTGIDPADGTLALGKPTHITVDFTHAVLPASVDPSAVSIGGIVASGFTLVDADTVVFEIDLTDLVEGQYGLVIAGGAVESIFGQTSQAMQGTFTYSLPPRVIASSIDEDETLTWGAPLIYTATFDHAIAEANLDVSDFILASAVATIGPDSFAYDSETKTLTLTFATVLDEGMYTLNLLSGNGRIEGVFGLDLDGEPNAASADNTPSGDGVPGGDFTVHFGNWAPPSEIHGVKWHDLNANKVKDPGEPGLDGWSIELLDANTGAVIDTQVTSNVDLNGNGTIEPATESGLYAFTGLPRGEYEVREVPQAGWQMTWPGSTGGLTFVQELTDGQDGVDGLDVPYSAVVSDDGSCVYATGHLDDAVAVFTRDPLTGRLTFVGAWKDGVGGVDGLDGAFAVAVAPDRRHVYVSGFRDDALAVFAQDAATNELSFVQVVKDGAGGVDGLRRVRGVTVSPDGKHVYAAGSADNAVAVFSRNIATGELSLVQTVKAGVPGLDSVYSVVVSPDGKNVYAVSNLADALVAFARDASTGELSFLHVLTDGVAGVDGLDGARMVSISPEGRHLYVAGYTDSALAVFGRDPATGQLVFVQVLRDADPDVDGLAQAASAEVSPDGRRVYVAAYGDKSVTVFARNALTGELAFAQMIVRSTGGGPYSAVISPDGRHVYSTAISGDVLTVYDRGEPIGHRVTVGPGQVWTSGQFGNCRLASLAGAVFEDFNGDGIRDPGETGLDGRTVTLVDVSGTAVAMRVTAGSDVNADGTIDPVTETGLFTFANFRPGAYFVRQTLPGGWVQTGAYPSDIPVTLSSGQDVAGLSVGAAQAGRIDGQIFEDVNGNAAHDANEPGLDGWAVELWSETGELLVMALTAGVDLNGNGRIDPVTESGLYSFVESDSGNYDLTMIVPVGYDQTYPDPPVRSISLSTGQMLAGQDFGAVSTHMEILGRLYHDLNGNGEPDADEPGLDGWAVELWSETGELLVMAITAGVDLNGDGRIDPAIETGLYAFAVSGEGTVVPTEGTYEVRQIVPAGWVQSAPDPALGAVMVTVAAGSTVDNVDFGNRALKSDAPMTMDLLPAGDTGASPTDDLTRLDNSQDDRKLRFEVTGTVAGGTVTVYSDGIAISEAVQVQGETTVVTTNGSYDLVDGEHSITARQTKPGKAESPDSPALTITVDTVAPTATWYSAATHDALGELLLEIADDGAFTEPRTGGIRMLVLEFSEEVDLSGASAVVAGNNDNDGPPMDLSDIDVDLSGRDPIPPDFVLSDTGEISFSSPVPDVGLPDVARYLVHLDGVIADRAGNALTGDCDRIMTSLIGDMKGDHYVVDVRDLYWAWAYKNQSADEGPGHTRADMDLNGTIDVRDLYGAWGKKNHGAAFNDPVLSKGLVAPSWLPLRVNARHPAADVLDAPSWLPLRVNARHPAFDSAAGPGDAASPSMATIDIPAVAPLVTAGQKASPARGGPPARTAELEPILETDLADILSEQLDPAFARE